MKRKKVAGGAKKKVKKKFSNINTTTPVSKIHGRPNSSEKKAFDIAETSILFETIAGVPTFQLLNGIVNGAELYQRIGRRITMKSVHIRGRISNSITDVQDIGRILIVYDSQANAALPTIQTVLQYSNAGATTSSLSEINLTNRQRFKILRDYQVTFPSVTNTAGVLTNYANEPPEFNVNIFLKTNLDTEYNSVNGGTILDITTGSLLIGAIIGGLTNAWVFNYACRIRYYDG